MVIGIPAPVQSNGFKTGPCNSTGAFTERLEQVICLENCCVINQSVNNHSAQAACRLPELFNVSRAWQTLMLLISRSSPHVDICPKDGSAETPLAILKPKSQAPPVQYSCARLMNVPHAGIDSCGWSSGRWNAQQADGQKHAPIIRWQGRCWEPAALCGLPFAAEYRGVP